MPSTLATHDVGAKTGSVRSRHRAAAVDISVSPLAVAPVRSDGRPSTAPLSEASNSLRRLPGDSRMRKRSSQSLRERSKPSADDPAPSPSAARRVKGSAPPSGNPSQPPSADISPPRTPEPRLGHPSRPYYTAIRKHMVQPTSQSPASTSLSQPAYASPRPSAEYGVRQSTDYVARSSTDYLGRTSGGERMSLPMRRVGGGSVSGEMELHMALAQRRSEDAPHSRPEYVFHETRPPPPEPRTHRSRLRRLSQGVRNLFSGRS
ncbi:hypothetical protein K488DRAFT_83856 [Vararia minispora EC-137]|uniref:Uncharacterized protein n=1 Tax=Vararia minispora EC-137 TaxID=1314806 RepID=A0ACB8QT02_9AGAM|nr:hypothetical protein K488DRAFT_83856 [Vararia minispora EC-137]